jgi:hypothetical protein
MTKKKREKTQITKIRNEKGDITTNTNEFQRIIRENFKNIVQVTPRNIYSIKKTLTT